MDGMGYFNPLQSWTSPTFPSRSPDLPSSGRIDWKAAQQEILSSHWVHRIQKLDFPQLHQLSWKIQQMILAISLGDLFGWSHPQQHFKLNKIKMLCLFQSWRPPAFVQKICSGRQWSKVSNCPPARCKVPAKAKRRGRDACAGCHSSWRDTGESTERLVRMSCKLCCIGVYVTVCIKFTYYT